MSSIVTIDYFQKLQNGGGIERAQPAALIPASARPWTRSYVYPRRLLAIGRVFASLNKAVLRPLTGRVAVQAQRVKESLYEGVVGALEFTGCIPTGRAEFGLARGETLSDFKVAKIRERHTLAMQLKRNYEDGQPDLNRVEIISGIDDATRVLDRVAVVQAARKGW